MANYLKEKEITFQLKDYEVKEDFVLWKKFGIQGDVLDPTGQPYQFPLRDGQVTGTDGIPRNIADIKFMKKVDFDKAYPKMNKKTSYQRNIFVNGQEYIYNFGTTANKKLNDLIATISSMGQNPLQIQFKQSFNKYASPAEMYSISIASQQMGLPQQGVMPQQGQPASSMVQQPNVAPVGNAPQNNPVASLNPIQSVVQTQQGVNQGLNDKEKDTLETIKAYSLSPVTEEQFKSIMAKNGYAQDRIPFLWQAFQSLK